jgi:hypothetical protein
VRVAWLLGGVCFGGVAVVCFYANLHEFAIGSAIVGLFMLSESWVGKD